MLDRQFIGHQFDPTIVSVDAGLLKLFAKATGQTNPVYFDDAAATAAGHRGLLAPPTYAFSLQLASRDLFPIIPLMGIDQAQCLHGEQLFRYHRQIFAGDRIELRASISDIYEKANGRLGFVVMQTRCTNQHDEHVVDMTITTIVRKP